MTASIQSVVVRCGACDGLGGGPLTTICDQCNGSGLVPSVALVPRPSLDAAVTVEEVYGTYVVKLGAEVIWRWSFRYDAELDAERLRAELRRLAEAAS